MTRWLVCAATFVATVGSACAAETPGSAVDDGEGMDMGKFDAADSGAQTENECEPACSGSKICYEGACVIDVDPGTPIADVDGVLREWIDIWTFLDRNYAAFVAKPELDWGQMNAEVQAKIRAADTEFQARNAIAEGVASIGDGHTEAVSAFLSQYDVHFAFGYSTLGACTALLGDGRVAVSSANPANPTGLMAGDVITAIDDRETDALITDILHQPGSSIPGSTEAGRRARAARSVLARIDPEEKTVSILRKGKPMDLRIDLANRAFIDDCNERPPVAGLVMGDNNVHTAALTPDVFYVRIDAFIDKNFSYEGTLADLTTATGKAVNYSGLIIDLRENKGGYAPAYYNLVGAVLGQGQFLFACSARSGDGHADFEPPSGSYSIDPQGERLLGDKDIVVLTDALTFSAGDFAGYSLSTASNVTTLGAPSGGGFTSVVTMPFGQDWQVSYAVLYCTQEDGTPLEGHPLPVDVAIGPTAEDLAAGVDTVLEAALARL